MTPAVHAEATATIFRIDSGGEVFKPSGQYILSFPLVTLFTSRARDSQYTLCIHYINSSKLWPVYAFGVMQSAAFRVAMETVYVPCEVQTQFLYAT
jgi:hypothetical protein